MEKEYVELDAVKDALKECKKELLELSVQYVDRELRYIDIDYHTIRKIMDKTFKKVIGDD